VPILGSNGSSTYVSWVNEQATSEMGETRLYQRRQAKHVTRYWSVSLRELRD